MKPRLSTLLFGRARQAYEALVLSVSALQVPLCPAEQVEFLTDAIDACDRIEALFDQKETLSCIRHPI
jgi:hypothetical protein